MTRRTACASLVLLLAAASWRVQAQAGSDRLVNAAKEARNWLTYSGGYFSHRYSGLTQITPANAKNLELKWTFQAQSLEKLPPMKCVHKLWGRRHFFLEAMQGRKARDVHPELPQIELGLNK